MENQFKAFSKSVVYAGGAVYYVGGCVRDLFLKTNSKDVDVVVTGLPIEKIEALLPGKFDLVGKAFGVIKAEFDGRIIDVALPRRERSSGSGHKDFVVEFGSEVTLEEDLARRDFTMNAIAVRAVNATVVDPFGGRLDVESRIIKCVGNPGERLAEDPLRILRAFRFLATKSNFVIETRTLAAIESNAHLISTVSSERVRDEFVKILEGDQHSRVSSTIRLMVQAGVMKYIIPELLSGVGFDQNNQHHHLDVFEHTLGVLGWAIMNNYSTRVRMAALLHDISKPECYSVDASGEGHFYEHDHVGSSKSREILNRLKFPTEFTEEVVKMVDNHLGPQKDWGDKAMRRFLARMGHLSDDAINLRESDYAAHAGGYGVAGEVHDAIRERILGLASIRGFDPRMLALNGGEVAALFGVTGRKIGELKEIATQAVIDGEVDNNREAIIKYLIENNQTKEAV